MGEKPNDVDRVRTLQDFIEGQRLKVVDAKANSNVLKDVLEKTEFEGSTSPTKIGLINAN